MKMSRCVVPAVRLSIIITGQIANASEGRRRSTGIGDNEVEIERLIKTPGIASLVITTSHKDDVTVMLIDKPSFDMATRRSPRRT